MNCNRNRIRVEGNTAKPYAELVNLLTGGAPIIPRARVLRLELGIYCDETFETDLSQVSSITAELKPVGNRTATALASKTVSSFSTITENQWESGETWHASLEFSEIQTALDMGGNDNLPLWLVITAETDQGPVTLAAGTASMVEDGGLSTENAPEPGDPGYYTKEQIDAMLVALGGSGFGPLVIHSPSKLAGGAGFQRRLDVDDAGNPIDGVTPIS